MGNFKEYLEYSIIGKKSPLPPPAESATLLREKSLGFLEEWNKHHGQHHKSIQLAITYVKNNLNMNFPLVVATTGQQQQQIEQQLRLQQILRLRYSRILDEYADVINDTDIILNQLTNSFPLLIPNFKNNQENTFFQLFDNSNNENDNNNNEEDEDENINRRETLRQLGIGNNEYELTIEINTEKPIENVIENKDNEVVITNVKDNLKLIVNKYFPLMKQYESTLIKVELPEEKQKEQQAITKLIIDLKQRI